MLKLIFKRFKNFAKSCAEGAKEAAIGIVTMPAETWRMVTVSGKDVPEADRAMFRGLTVAMILVALALTGTIAVLVIAAV